MQDEPGSLESLVLDAYDILRVCSQHQEGTIDHSEIELPLDELRDLIKVTVSAHRAEMSGANRVRKSPEERLPIGLPAAKRRRK